MCAWASAAQLPCCNILLIGLTLNQDITFAHIVGLRADESQWDHALCVMCEAWGMSITRGKDMADAACLASPAARRKTCIRMDGERAADVLGKVNMRMF